MRFKLRNFTPRGLFARSMLIVVLPIALIQIAISYLFFDEHWQEASRRLSDGIAGNVAFFVALHEQDSDPEKLAQTAETAWRTSRMSFALRPDDSLPTSQRRSVFAALDRTLARSLNNSLDKPFWFDTTRYPDFIDIRVQLDSGVLRALAYRERTFVTNGHIFLLWSIGATALITLIALAFLKNQIKPILRLTEAADAIGRGLEPPDDFRASGALEIREAAESIKNMRDRLVRFTEQRTALLASVSHDLRTPLTRLKLTLAMLEQDEDVKAAQQDVGDMQVMLDEYLAFARGAEGEAVSRVSMLDLAQDAVRAAQGRKGEAKLIMPAADVDVSELSLEVRPMAIRRCLTNLVQNAADHAAHVEVSAQAQESWVYLFVDDDGPGIPETQYEEAFKPFARLDASRNQNASGVGLGLAISRDAARSHGGEVTLSRSPMGGLRASLSLPKERAVS
jgi:two-component system osmolarity sensor histidine kinase EnvZ